MWMVEGNDHGKLEFKISADRKLRPLMPRPISSCSTTSSPFSALSNPSCFCTHNPNILPSWNHHPIGGVSDYGVKREMPLGSTRWNPTPEQLQALEEMYRRGTRTPSAEQIQQIAAKLRRFGKIEGKNVFYWFQNHKARERQKKRRQLELQLSGKKQTELRSRRYFEIEHHKKLSASPSNCSAPSEGSAASMQYGTGIAECKKGEWTQLGQKINVIAAKNESSCWKLDLSSPNNNSSLLHTINATPKYSALEQENTKPFAASSLNLSMLLSPKNDDISIVDERSSEIRENRTLLQLFPTGSVDSSFRNATREEAVIHDVSTRFTPNHEFIEFLPTKN